MDTAAKAFEQHVALDEGVLATSAPLEIGQLDCVILQVSEGLAGYPDLSQKTYELRTQLVEEKAIGAAGAIEGVLELLKANEKALEYFKGSIVGVLTGQPLPLRPPFFGGTIPEPAAEAVVAEVEAVAAEAAPKGEAKTSTKSTAASEEKLAPIFANQQGSARKRSLEKTTTTVQGAEGKRPKAEESEKNKKDIASPPLRAALAEETKYESEEVKIRAMNPTYTIPTQWEHLYFKQVEVINISNRLAKERIQAKRFAGEPFLLEGHTGWLKFADGWIKPDGTLDAAAFLSGIHDVKVPVLERNYEERNPIKTHLPLSYYVKNYWEHGKSDYYLHQWQFPLDPKAGPLLCYKSQELPVLGDNLLLYWLDAVRGDNPLQYLFMGQKSTRSRMHLDPGGLGITIAPVIGTKRVTMLHREAAKLDSVHESVNFHDVDLDQIPQLAFLPAWRVDVKPGQILYMPEGTLHACENVTACLSYHRFHVDTVNLPGFLRSFLAQDSPTINHAEILWNAAHDVMSAMEDIYHANNQVLGNEVVTLRKLDTLRGLRHACRMLSLEQVLPTEDSWDWKKLLDDIDHLLVRIDSSAKLNKKKNSTHESTLTKAMAALNGEEAAEAKQIIEAAANKKKLAVKTKAQTTAANTHWDSLKLKVGDIIGVQVFEKRNRAEVLKVVHDKVLVQIHYSDWESIYDEFLPVSSLYQRKKGKKVALKKTPEVHETVMARWGSKGDVYNAIVLKVIRTNACYVHYLKYEKDWDQWILPGHIFRKYNKA
ncbi:Cupin-like domain [Phytophthora infestans]|uniref:Cupin-like domain n=1 Tax=Phytophthora infestans TaxID=4787 RepID=A0A833SJC7_PHYIN|nr:Cupin-like domain [Phytophthora infestans]KAF4129841.1 Cupin-like domain [Phytophthora infestans]